MNYKYLADECEKQPFSSSNIFAELLNHPNIDHDRALRLCKLDDLNEVEKLRAELLPDMYFNIECVTLHDSKRVTAWLVEDNIFPRGKATTQTEAAARLAALLRALDKGQDDEK